MFSGIISKTDILRVRVLSSIVRMATFTPKTTSIKAKSTCDAILTKEVVVAQPLLKMEFFSKINLTLIPKIQMKSKRSKSSPKWKTRHKELHSRQGIFITQISRPAVSKWAHLQKYHQQWGSVELLYFPLCIYNGVKGLIAALNFYVPPRTNKNRGLRPTKSALLKQTLLKRILFANTPHPTHRKIYLSPKYLQKIATFTEINQLLNPSFRMFPRISNKNYEVRFVLRLCEQEKVIIDWKMKFVTLHEQLGFHF